jgi:ketosteroid isomerase-like protein
MAGCVIAPCPCEKEEEEKQTPEEQENEKIVRDHIESTWNVPLTNAEKTDFIDARARGDRAHLPQRILAKLNALVAADIVRHRRKINHSPTKCSGITDYIRCIHEVYSMTENLKVKIVDLRTNGPNVVASFEATGTNKPIDPGVTPSGAFGLAGATGKPFRYQTSALYVIKDGKICEDFVLYPEDIVHTYR